MSAWFERLRELLRDSPFVAGEAGTALASAFEPLLERRGDDAAAAQMSDAVLAGLGRAVATSPEIGRYLSARGQTWERLCRIDAKTLHERGLELVDAEPPSSDADLETFLDDLRLHRRDETALAACLYFGGAIDDGELGLHLSAVAEASLRWALEAALRRDREQPPVPVSVLGMGKIAGRAFTFHSDLDLIFLYGDEIGDMTRPARTAQRLIGYLTTLTGAGVLYAVDSRLRPSGRKGALVSTFGAFERYQLEHAATWEHLALMRSRALAGEVERAQGVLQSTRATILERNNDPWSEVWRMRGRVEQERGSLRPDVVPFKAGRGGLMEAEFLATGGMLEAGRQMNGDELPRIAAMFEAVCGPGRPEPLLEAYAFLRRLETCTRWVANRAVEELDLSAHADAVAELVAPGQSPAALRERISAARDTVRAAWEAVAAVGGISAL